MFKLAMFVQGNGISIDPLTCVYISSYVGTLAVITASMLNMIRSNENASNWDKMSLIIIEDVPIRERIEMPIVKSIQDAIKHLSKNHSDVEWWFIGDNATCNKLIRQGIVMNIHVSIDWDNTSRNTIIQEEKFDWSLLNDSEFEMISTTKCLNSPSSKSVRHYMRMNKEEMKLLSSMQNIIQNGFKRPTRTGIDTLSVFGQQFEYRMNERTDSNGVSSYRLPLLTTKKMFTRGVFAELKWILSGGTSSKTLEAQGVNIWKGNTTREYLDSVGLSKYDEGEAGPIYGFQWKHWGAKYEKGKHDYTGEGIDQVTNVIKSLETNPFGRRHIISGWAPDQLDDMCLPPCHVLYQFMVHEEGNQKYLSLMMYQRSCDTFLGLPFNICSLGMFLTLMAHRVNMKPYKLIHSVADMHIYENHIEAVNKQLKRKACMFPYIHVNCDPKDKLEDYEFENIVIEDYFSHGVIKADMAA